MKPYQARAARAILRLGIRDVAEGANLSPNTIVRLEDDSAYPSRRSTMALVRMFYEQRGIAFESNGTFFDENVGRVFEGLKNG